MNKSVIKIKRNPLKAKPGYYKKRIAVITSKEAKIDAKLAKKLKAKYGQD